MVDFSVGRRLHGTQDESQRRRWLLTSVAVNLGILGFFKYSGFFVDSLSALTSSLGLGELSSALRVVLPVGISFYTFQTMSYTFDIFRHRIEPTRSLIDFGTYVAYFPQLVAGSIERAQRLLPQVENHDRPKPLGDRLVAAGASRYVDFRDLLNDDQFYDYTHPDRRASHELTRALVEALGAR